MSELHLKEAIKILTQEKKKVELKLAKAYDSFCLYPNERDQNDWDHFSALDSAFEMGISALVELNNKKSSDTINRQDAIDAVHKNYDTILDFKSDGRTIADSFEDIINALPSAQPERESIKWIPHKSIFGGLGERVYTCNKCGYNIGFHVENFCPNCGARTEGVSDE